MRRPRLLPALFAVLILLLSACSGSEDTSDTTEGGDTDASDVDAATEEDTAPADPTEEEPAEADPQPTEPADTEPAEADGEPITVGILTSTSGFLGGFGEQYLDGLEAGLDYATDGTRAVNGRPIELEIVDDAADPEQAISSATDLIGRGVTIIAGTVSSGIGIQMAPFAEENNVLYISGPAASDALTGLNRNTFRSGRQTFQDVATAATLV
ncbi:MAG TPA: ABC transporter substrate-binding protein, partial [Euzebya sp.]|nr:ABC transporter substrate-binding protein [Euzebya sp.]